MNILLRAYLAAGVTFILAVYVITLSLWFDATLNGIYYGQFVSSIDTNVFGESTVVLLLIFFFLPSVAWVFTRGLMRAAAPEARS
ncbi:MAG: hypothetical protein JRN09_08940 [Nitrososphaerota archaeon]|nr:hypothetical protein [Nitrososphaerota archaeon]